jgi:signal transduction histidine kinase
MGDEERGRRAVKRVLRTDSDRLLDAVDELRALERQKRQLDVASKPFHDLAERVEAKAREVFRLAGQEADDGESADALADPAIVEGVTIDGVDAANGD